MPPPSPARRQGGFLHRLGVAPNEGHQKGCALKNTTAEIAEKYLRSQHASNLRQKIWPSNNLVIDRFLKDSVNLCGAWGELLTLYPCGNFATGRTCEKWQMVLDTIVDVAAGWSPGKVFETRQAIKDVEDLTKEIQNKAEALAELLRRRSRIPVR